MEITNFTDRELQNLRREIETALSQIASKNGIELSLGRMTYDSTSFTAKVTGKTSQNNIKVASNLNLPQDIVGRKFLHNGQTYTVTELKAIRQNFPVVAQAQNGRLYKFTTVLVNTNLL